MQVLVECEERGSITDDMAICIEDAYDTDDMGEKGNEGEGKAEEVDGEEENLDDDEPAAVTVRNSPSLNRLSSASARMSPAPALAWSSSSTPVSIILQLDFLP